jgi:hypothetical protein
MHTLPPKVTSGAYPFIVGARPCEFFDSPDTHLGYLDDAAPRGRHIRGGRGESIRDPAPDTPHLTTSMEMNVPHVPKHHDQREGAALSPMRETTKPRLSSRRRKV